MPQSQSSFVRSAKKFYKKLNLRALPIASIFGIVGANLNIMSLFKQFVRFASDAETDIASIKPVWKELFD
ncbi:hypothetical protein ACMFMG_002124 [Clarireedia jacksonii]